MAKRSETITMSEADMREAITTWLINKYGDHAEFRLQLHCSKSSHGQGWAEVDTETYSATATRDIS